jgi:hypothetical protein
VRDFLLFCILFVLMASGCIQREQNARIEGHLRSINAILQTGLKVRVEIPRPKAPAGIEEQAERDT